MGDDPKAFPRLIGLTVFTQIFGGQRVRFEPSVVDSVLDSVGRKSVALTLEMLLRASS